VSGSNVEQRPIKVEATVGSTSNDNNSNDDTEGVLPAITFSLPCCPEKEADCKKLRHHFLMGTREDAAFETIDFNAAIPIIRGTLKSSLEAQQANE